MAEATETDRPTDRPTDRRTGIHQRTEVDGSYKCPLNSLSPQNVGAIAYHFARKCKDRLRLHLPNETVFTLPDSVVPWYRTRPVN